MTVLQIFAGRIWGGAEQYVLDLSAELGRRGHTVRFAARDTAPLRSRLANEPLDVTFMPMRRHLDRPSRRELARLMEGADVVHIHDIHDLPMVVSARRLATSQPRIVLTRHIARASRVPLWHRRHLSQLHRIIFVSGLARRLWQGANPSFPDARCSTVINSISPTHLQADAAPRDAADAPLIAFTGRIRRSKGCETLIRALARVADRPWRLVMVGACKPKDYISRLEQLAASLGIADRVTFTGFRRDVAAIISRAGIGVAPSIVREACPLSPMEYMQQGVCVIATDNGAQPEYITSGSTGLLVPPADVDALAAALADMLDHPERRRAIAEAGRRHFDTRMSYAAFVTSVLGAYSP